MEVAQEVERLVATTEPIPGTKRTRTRNLLPWNRRERLEEEKRMHEEQLRNAYVQDKGPAQRSIGNINRLLEGQAPVPTVSGPVKDALYTEKKRLAEKLREGMPTKEEMWRGGPHIVHRHMQWEKSNKDTILRYKNVARQLEPDSSDPDLANIESFRPQRGTAGHTGFDADAHFKGNLSYVHVPEENWPKDMPLHPENSAMAQSVKAQPKAKRARKELTEAQKQQARENLALARAAKAQAKEAA